MASEVKWIKITTDMFDNRKIRHLRKLPEGNNIVLIWVMLLTMAGRCNANGMIFLTENIPYTPKMLADELDFEETTITLALQALERFNMIVVNQNYFAIAGWEDHQNIEGLEKIRQQTRDRVARCRERQKALEAAKSNAECSVTVTQSNTADIDKEIEKDKDIEIYNTIVSYLNQKAGTAYRPTTAKTKAAINARIAEGFNVDDFKAVIDKKCAEWIDTEWEKFLRPETLFGTKFESYLNAKAFKKQATSNHAELTDLDDIF